MNPAEYRFIEGLHSVRGEEQYAIIVLQLTQKHGDERVEIGIVRPLSQKHICFIEQ